MSMVFNMVGGGGGEKPQLLVTAPTGSTVTATQGGVTMQATEVSGVWTFQLPEFGVWTVTATKDGQSATKSINVVQDYNAALSYFSAAIAVTYPAGSTCTCTDGVTTLTATDTSGSYTFIVPNAGTWTIFCTDGTDTDSAAVSITTDGQSVSATLSYRLYLYNEGDECTDVTGGWSARAWKQASNSGTYSTGGADVTKGTSTMTVSVSASYNHYKSGVVEVANDIDLTGVDSLKIISDNTFDSAVYKPMIAVVSRSATYWGTGAVASATLETGNVESSVDVSALSGSYDIVVGVSSNALNVTTTTVISKIWLE